jgi:hypothetical protein
LNAPFKSSIDVATGTTSSGIFWAGAVPAPNNYAQVSTIQDGLQYPIGLTATAGALYWTERGDSPWNCTSDTHQGRIWTSGLDGSNPHPIAAGQPDPMGIAVTPEAVYWTNDDVTYDSNCNGMGNGSVVRFDLNTSDITTVATNQNQPGTALLAVDGSIFWSGQGMQALYAGASSPTLLGWFGGVNLASDGSNLYWADYGNYPNAPGGQVWQLPLTGGTPLSLASGQAQTWDVQTDGANVYFSDQAWQQPFPASINSVPVGGGPVTNLATGNEIMKVFGIDSSSAYYASNGLLYTVPLNGSAAPKVLAPLELGGCPEGNLVVSGHNVYWTDTCSQSVQHASW